MSEIRIPYRSPDALVADVIDCAREVLDGDELRVTEQVAFDALERGVRTVGGLLSELESAGTAGRHQILDKARVGVGMDTVADEEAHAAFVAANAALPPAATITASFKLALPPVALRTRLETRGSRCRFRIAAGGVIGTRTRPAPRTISHPTTWSDGSISRR